MKLILPVVFVLMCFNLIGCAPQNIETTVYPIVKIGNQVWIAKNLDLETDESGCYANDSMNCEKYGRLYTWRAAKKACPAGFHLPTIEEFAELIAFVGGEEYAGEELKSKTGWAENENGSDAYGFSALPAGVLGCGLGFNFCYLGDLTYFWSSTEISKNDVYSLYLSYDDKVDLQASFKGSALSVRCVKD